MDLKNRVALITGAAHRVGKQIALTLAREGVHIAVHFHRSKNQAEETRAEIAANGVQAILVRGDFARVDEISAVVQTTLERFSKIDFLINNAAVYFKTPFGQVSESQWETLLNINLKAAFFCAQAVGSHMKHRGEGKIINITDVAGITPWSQFLPYSISKAGVISMTKGLAIALAPEVQVNAIALGTVLMSEGATEAYTQKIRDNTLLKRIGSPQDVAETVKFLLSGTDYMTGSVVTVDGGKLLT